MLGRIGTDAGSLLGIEIAPSSVRLLQLRRGQPCAWAQEPLPSGAVEDGLVNDPEALAEALQRAFARSGARQRRVALALPASRVISKTLRLPAGLGDDEFDERLRLEAEQFVPFGLEEAALDYQRLGPAEGGDGLLDVSFCACHQVALDGLEAAVELAGLYPRVVDIDSHALARALGQRLLGPTALLQVEDGQLVYHRLDRQRIGQRRETREALARDQVVEQVDRWLLAEADMAEQLWLCGARADEGLAVHLQQRLGIACGLFEPCEGPERRAVPAFALAYGLALRGDS